MSILFGLEPEEAQTELELRAEKLAAALAETESVLTDGPAGLPRLSCSRRNTAKRFSRLSLPGFAA